MRSLWLVTIIFSVSLQSGCNAQPPTMLHTNEAMPGCTPANKSDAQMAVKIAIPYFKQASEVKITSVSAGNVSLCQSHLVVPIVATTEHINTPRLWFIEIDRENPKQINLIRSE